MVGASFGEEEEEDLFSIFYYAFETFFYLLLLMYVMGFETYFLSFETCFSFVKTSIMLSGSCKTAYSDVLAVMLMTFISAEMFMCYDNYLRSVFVVNMLYSKMIILTFGLRKFGVITVGIRA